MAFLELFSEDRLNTETGFFLVMTATLVSTQTKLITFLLITVFSKSKNLCTAEMPYMNTIECVFQQITSTPVYSCQVMGTTT